MYMHACMFICIDIAISHVSINWPYIATEQLHACMAMYNILYARPAFIINSAMGGNTCMQLPPPANFIYMYAFVS